MDSVAIAVRSGSGLLGDIVEGVDLTEDLDESAFADIERHFNDKGLLVFRDQRLAPEQHIRFSRRFGNLEIHVVKQYLLPGHPEIFKVSNLVENGKRVGASAEYWHSDLTYVAIPARCSLLYAIETPVDVDGTPLGDTLFASTSAAYDALPESMKRRIEGLVGIHRFSDVYNREQQRRAAAGLPPMAGGPQTQTPVSEIKAQTPDVHHPMVRTHPFTGRKCLYVNEGFTVGIVGMPEQESGALLNELFAHCTRPEFVYRHKWRNGDLVMWDNCSTIHKAAGNYGPQHRRMLYRTTVTGTAPF